tara:strand:- start:628 stop:1707 length:1080 start_codon:yes stop_codon:yes gene_type:complete
MKVCILGFNLTSLTLAKMLVNQKINVDISFCKKPQGYDKSRTLGISKSNVEFFNKNIINIEKIIWKLKRIEIFTDNLKKKESLLNFEKKYDQIFSIAKNYQLLELIEKSLSKNMFFKKLFSTNYLLNFDAYDLVINTDYLHPITKKYFSKKTIKKYNSIAFTTLIKHEKIDNRTASQIFTRRGPLAFLPISKTQTSIVYSIHNSTNKKKDNIEELVNHYNYKYNIIAFGNLSSFELNSLNLRSYYHKNILAFGDLLHKIHPLAGQGFNMTLRDIKVLLSLIKNKIELGLPLDQSVNSEFEKISKHKNYLFSNGIDFVQEFFNLERKSKSNVLSKSIQLLGNNPSIKNLFIKIADRGEYF